MVWETYTVLWITACWLAAVALWVWALVCLERLTLDREPTVISKWAVACVAVVGVVAVLLALLGRVANLNLENPVPLRWSDAFFSGNSQVAAVGLNPVLFLYDTLKVGQAQFDEATVREHYSQVAEYLGVDQPDPQQLNFTREQGVQPYRLQGERPPNVIFVMLESLGTSAVGAYGNPLNPTPNLDTLATQSWFFKHFYVPVTGTAWLSPSHRLSDCQFCLEKNRIASATTGSCRREAKGRFRRDRECRCATRPLAQNRKGYRRGFP